MAMWTVTMIDGCDFIQYPEVGADGRLMSYNFGSPSAGPSKKEQEAQRKAQEKQDKEMRKLMKQMSKQHVPMPAIPTPPEPEPIPPVASQSSANVEDAQQDARRQAKRRKGLMATTYAGDTGGYGGSTPLGGGKSLLG